MNIFPIHRFCQVAFGLLLLIILTNARISAQNTTACFQLFFPTVEAQPGDTVCLPLMARDFDQIVSLQFVVFWNSDELELISKDINDSALLGIMSNSFGPVTGGQQLPMGWSSITGDAISRPDSAVLFRLCFKVKNGANGFLPLHIGGTWQNQFEVAQVFPGLINFLPLTQQIGGISTNPVPNSTLTVSSSCIANAFCNQAVGSASVEVSGGVAPYQYAWTGQNGFSAATPDISGLAGGQYQVVVTDQTGSSVTVEVYVQSATYSLTAISQTTPAFCGQANGCATLQVAGTNGPFLYQWSSGGSHTTENCNLAPGLHNVTITDASGCQTSISVKILHDSIIEIPGKWLVIEDCNDTESLTVTPLNQPGPFEYLWSTGETTATVEGLTEGFYTVTVTAVYGGCSSVGEFLVFNSSTESWGLKLEPICDDPGNSATGSLVLDFQPTGSIVFPVTVFWSDGTTKILTNALAPGILDSLNGVPSGHYSVTVTDAAGCSTLREKTLNCTVPPPASEHYPWFYVQGHGANPDSCSGVYAKNFEGVSSLSFSLSWATYGSTLREIRNLQLPGLTLNDFNLMSDKLGLNWQSLSPITLPAESLLFEVCLNPITGQVADPLEFAETPIRPSLSAQGESLAFLGRHGFIYYNTFQEAGPIFCKADVLPTNCSADGKSSILMELCNPEMELERYYGHMDSLGKWHYFEDLSGMLFSDPGSYFIYAGQPNVTSETYLVIIPATPAQPECVWPGDADNNNAVNHHDLLYLGIAFDAQGLARPNAATAWTGQDAVDWTQKTALRNVNFKNIDTNGDGLVNAVDTMAIVQNWGRVIDPSRDNPFDAPLDSFGDSPFPDLTIATDTLRPGESVNFPLLLGSQNSQLDNIYGLAFSISYDPKVVKDNIRFTPSPSWFGNQSQFLWIQKNFPRQGRLDVAITRTDGVPVSGWGAIGNVFIIIEDDIFGIQSLQDTIATSHLFFSEISSTSPGETPQVIDAPPVELVVRKQTVATHESVLLDRDITLSPNPVSRTLFLESKSSAIRRVEISSADGSLRQVLELGNTGRQVQIGIEKLPAGTYFARVFYEEGVVVKKFVVAR